MSPLPLVKNVFDRKLAALRIHAAWRWHAVSRHLRRERLRRTLAQTAGPLAFTFHAPGDGLFAHLTWCLHVAAWAAKAGRAFRVSCTSPNYGDPEGGIDWFSRVLEHRAARRPSPATRTFKIRAFEELPFYAETTIASLEEARSLFHRSFRLAPPLAERVAALKKNLFQDRFVIGLHYRGTDKQLEAERLPYEAALASARRALASAEAATGTPPALFLATDEMAFVAETKRALAPYPVLCLEAAVRSNDGQPIHQGAGCDRSAFAVDAMTDALLLGECRLLLKTASMLSGWSLVMSPPRPVLMLNQPRPDRSFFPDRLIVPQAYLPGAEEQAVAAVLEESLVAQSDAR